MKISKRIAIVVTLTVSAGLQAQQPPPPEALDGVDPVVLLNTGKEAFGKSAFRSTYGPLTYLFSSAETKAAFDAAPDKYAVQRDGLCARMGGATYGNPSMYAVVDGKIYLFGSDACRTAFVAAPAKFTPPVPAPMPASADAMARGRQLLDRAAAAHGGAALDRLSTYREQFQSKIGPNQENTLTTTLTWRFPDAVRSDRTFTMGGEARTGFTVLRGGGGATGFSGRLRPLVPASVSELQPELHRQLVPLLRNRAAEGTRIAWLGTGSVEGTTVDRVRILRGALDVMVNIESSGRVHSLRYVGRGTANAFGDVTVVFEDFRSVGPLLVPFTEKLIFDGALLPALSRTLMHAEIDPAVDPAFFEVTASKGE